MCVDASSLLHQACFFHPGPPPCPLPSRGQETADRAQLCFSFSAIPRALRLCLLLGVRVLPISSEFGSPPLQVSK